MIADLATATATPVEIDTEIARLQGDVAQFEAAITRARRKIRGMEPQSLVGDGIDAWRDGVNSVIDANQALIEEATAHLEAIYTQLRPLHTEFQRRGGWNRFYLVDAHGGHVHSSMSCSSCYPSTRYYWLINESGKTRRLVVHQAQAQACTVCFPWAPVTDKRGSYRTPSQAEAEQRAAEKAERAAAKKAAEITAPGGASLREAESRDTDRVTDGSVIKTEASAWRRAMGDAGSLAWYGDDHPHAPGWIETVKRCVAALAARREVTEESLRAELDKRIAAKAKRDSWTVKWFASPQH